MMRDSASNRDRHGIATGDSDATPLRNARAPHFFIDLYIKKAGPIAPLLSSDYSEFILLVSLLTLPDTCNRTGQNDNWRETLCPVAR